MMNELSRPIPSPWCSEISLQGPTAPPGQPGLPIRPGSNTAWAVKYSLLPSSLQGRMHPLSFSGSLSSTATYHTKAW